MKHCAIAMLLALIGSASLSGKAMACPEGETRFRNGVQYTCTCNSLGNGQKTCVWRAD